MYNESKAEITALICKQIGIVEKQKQDMINRFEIQTLIYS